MKEYTTENFEELLNLVQNKPLPVFVIKKDGTTFRKLLFTLTCNNDFIFLKNTSESKIFNNIKNVNDYPKKYLCNADEIEKIILL